MSRFSKIITLYLILILGLTVSCGRSRKKHNSAKKTPVVEAQTKVVESEVSISEYPTSMEYEIVGKNNGREVEEIQFIHTLSIKSKTEKGKDKVVTEDALALDIITSKKNAFDFLIPGWTEEQTRNTGNETRENSQKRNKQQDMKQRKVWKNKGISGGQSLGKIEFPKPIMRERGMTADHHAIAVTQFAGDIQPTGGYDGALLDQINKIYSSKVRISETRVARAYLYFFSDLALNVEKSGGSEVGNYIAYFQENTLAKSKKSKENDVMEIMVYFLKLNQWSLDDNKMSLGLSFVSSIKLSVDFKPNPPTLDNTFGDALRAQGLRIYNRDFNTDDNIATSGRMKKSVKKKNRDRQNKEWQNGNQSQQTEAEEIRETGAKDGYTRFYNDYADKDNPSIEKTDGDEGAKGNAKTWANPVTQWMFDTAEGLSDFFNEGTAEGTKEMADPDLNWPGVSVDQTYY